MIQKPYNLKVNGIMINGNSIDPTLVNTFSWSSSGDVSTAFQVQIYDNVSNNLVFDSGKVTTYAITYDLPASKISSNRQFKILVTAFDSLGNSATSYGQIFTTSLTPTVTINTIDNPVASQTYNFSATYTQTENVALASYIVFLYDSNQNILGQSNSMTGLPVEYMFQGLQSGESYYVEIQCTSFKGLTGTTGKIPFNVQYSQPVLNTAMNVANHDDTGTIDVSWNVIQVVGSTDISGTITYIGGEEVDLTSGKNIWFDSGFNIDSDFTTKIWLNSPVHNVNLVTLTGSNGVITLQYQDDNTFHVYKTMNANTMVAHIHSSVVQTTSQYPNYCVVIQQIGNNLNVIAQIC